MSGPLRPISCAAQMGRLARALRGPYFVGSWMTSETFVGFVDVGFLRAAGATALKQCAAALNPNAAEVVNWLHRLGNEELGGASFLRAYWYDGAFDPSHHDYAGQRSLLDAIGRTHGIQLRTGHIAEHPNPIQPLIRNALRQTATDLGLEPQRLLDAFDHRWQFRPVRQQKGVDTLIALDIVRLAQRPAYNTPVLFAGDRDLAEAVRTAQDFGARVIVATPRNQGVAHELVQLADGVISIAEKYLQLMLRPRAPRAG